jgi:nitrate/TMAO reductase-like tetraheme cytochrome c subunit/mono/diheme cytochrome c family protein
MMRRIRTWLQGFFFPPPGSRRIVRLLPYIFMGFLSLIVLTTGVYTWEYTNSPEFCGTACHTMPPEYTSYLASPHARVDCVDCHIGRGFIATRITRKAGDIKHILSLATKSYEFPIRADELRPARETCERCHFPQKFSDDSLREIKTFSDDLANTPSSTYLTMKTGGGSAREGLGRGIHWHIENQVSIQTEDLQLMDCITCHNRITHLVAQPEDAVDQMLARGLISTQIPEIRRKSVEVLRAEYDSKASALQGIAGLSCYYETYYADFFNENNPLIEQAITRLQEYYDQSVFPEQKADWDSHANNLGHLDSPGCFRCHDGNHLNTLDEAIRLECNLCHSIPVVADPTDFIVEIEISRGPEPESHLNPNWISLHRDVFDASCSNCHTTENPGGADNSSFCSNSACHGTVWEYAGFDAPGLREILLSQLPGLDESPISESAELTYQASIGPLLDQRCVTCHGENGIQGLDLSSYKTTLAGGMTGPADPDASLIIQRQTGDLPHFAQFTQDEIQLIVDWIEAGAPEE